MRWHQEQVERWYNEWVPTMAPHWGDRIDWDSAKEIARRLDEAAPQDVKIRGQIWTLSNNITFSFDKYKFIFSARDLSRIPIGCYYARIADIVVTMKDARFDLETPPARGIPESAAEIQLNLHLTPHVTAPKRGCG